ncbi:hypothetical protein ACOSQ4_010743 [Xanthoceras sorbifolium]
MDGGDPIWISTKKKKKKILKFEDELHLRSSKMNFIFEVHLRRTTNPLGSCLRTQKGSCLRTLWVPRTQRVRSSNPLGSTNPEGFVSSNPSGFEIEPSGFHEPRRVRIFEPFWVRDRTLWVPRTQKGSKPMRVRSSNPSGFVEPRGFEDRTLWVLSRTQKGSKIRTLLGSWNPEGSKIEPSGFDLEPRRVRSSNPSGFEIESRRVRRHEPFWIRRHEPRRVRSSNPSGFEIEPRGVRSSNPLGSISNPEGSSFFEPFWVRDRTQKGSIFEPSGFDLEPRGFVVLRR